MSLKFIAGFVDSNEEHENDIDLEHTGNDIEGDGRVYEKQRDPPGMCRFIICIVSFVCNGLDKSIRYSQAYKVRRVARNLG